MNRKMAALAACTMLSGLLQVVVAQPSFAAETLQLEIDDVAWANRDSGSATVTGTIACEAPSSVNVYVEMTQKKNGNILYVENGKTIDCIDTTSWTLTLNPSGTRAFVNGLAAIDASASATGQETDEVSKTVGVKSCTIIGTPESETIHGTSRKDIICGLAGDDVIYGAGRNDVIRSYKGADTVYGGAGNDTVLAGFGDDNVYGGVGDDNLDGDEGDDYLAGGRDKDLCTGGTNYDRFDGCETTQQGG
jgi:Ca2+-binding RTX toxin-like protein